MDGVSVSGTVNLGFDAESDQKRLKGKCAELTGKFACCAGGISA